MANPFDDFDTPDAGGVATAKPAAPAVSAQPQANPFDSFDAPKNPFDSFDQAPAKVTAEQLAQKPHGEIFTHAAQNPDDFETAYQADKLRRERPLMAKAGESLSNIPSGIVQGVKGFGNFIGGAVQLPFHAAQQAYYGATGDPRQLTAQAENTLAAQHGEGALTHIAGAVGGALDAIDPSSWLYESPKMKEETARLQFQQRVQQAKNELQLAQGRPLDTGAIAGIYHAAGQQPSEEVGPEALRSAGVAPADQGTVNRLAAVSDPTMLALSAAPQLPGARAIGGAAAELTGKVVGGTGRALAATTHALSPLNAIRRIANPASIATDAAKEGGARGLSALGDILEQQGKELRTGAPSPLTTKAATAAATGESALGVNAQRAIGDAAAKGAATAAGMAPLNAALSEGDPEALAQTTTGAGVFGGALGAFARNRPQMVEALRPHLQSEGARALAEAGEGNDPLAQKSAAYVMSLPEEARNRTLETIGALQGLPTNTPDGQQRAKVYVLNDSDYRQVLADKFGQQQAAMGGGRGFYLDNDGKAYVNGDYHSGLDPSELSHTVGHEFGGHAAINIMRAAGAKGGALHDGLMKTVAENLMPGGRVSPEFYRFIADYNRAFDPTGQTKRLDPRDPEAMEEWISEQAGQIIAGKGAGEIALPRNLQDKINDGIGRFMGGLLGMDTRKVGTETHFGREEVGAITKAVQDTLEQVVGMKLRGGAEIPEPAKTDTTRIAELNQILSTPRPPAGTPVEQVHQWIRDQRAARTELSQLQEGAQPAFPASGAAPTPPRAPTAPTTPTAPAVGNRASVAAALRLNGIPAAEAAQWAQQAEGATTEEMVLDVLRKRAGQKFPSQKPVAPTHEQTQTSENQPAVLPPAATSAQNTATDVRDALGSIGKGATDVLYEKLFTKLKNGDLTELGKPSNLLKKAKPHFDAGLISSPESFKEWVQNGEPNLPPAEKPTAENPVTNEPPTQNENGTLPTGRAGVQEQAGEGVAATEPIQIFTPEHLDQIAAQAREQFLSDKETAKSGKNKGQHTAANTKAAEKAAFDAAAAAHAQTVPENYQGLRQRTDAFGKTSVSGKVDPSRPFDAWLIKQAKESGNLNDESLKTLLSLQDAIGQTVSYDYGHAPTIDEGDMPTKAGRAGQQAEHTVAKRLSGESPIQTERKTSVPLRVGFNPGSKSFTVYGASQEKLLNNFNHLTEKMGDLGILAPFRDINDPRFVAAFKAVIANHEHGWTGDGKSPSVGTEEFPNTPDLSWANAPEHTVVPDDQFQFINAILADEGAKPPTRGDATVSKAKAHLANENRRLLNSEGETNPLRQQINEAEPGWTKATLEDPLNENISPALASNLGPASQSDESIRQHGKVGDLSRFFPEGQTPNRAKTAAGFLPSTEKLSPKEAAMQRIAARTKGAKSGSFMPDTNKPTPEGKGITAYHSTSSEPFDKFDPAKIGSSVGHSDPVSGFYFSATPGHSSHIAEGEEGKFRTAKVSLDLKNPFKAKTYADVEQFGTDGESARYALEKAGYDGVIFADGDEIVAFHPEQVTITDQGKMPSKEGATPEGQAPSGSPPNPLSSGGTSLKTLYRASDHDDAKSGAHFSENESDAKAYQDNPGFGGSKLQKFKVDASRVADVATLRDLASSLEPILNEEQRQWADDNGGLLEAMKGMGYDHTFHALENSFGPRGDRIDPVELLSKDHDWIRFTDDFPEGAKSWRYIGDKRLTPETDSASPVSKGGASDDVTQQRNQSFMPDTSKPEDGETPGERLMREAEAVGLRPSLDTIKGVLKGDQQSYEKLRAMIRDRTGKAARFLPDTDPVKAGLSDIENRWESDGIKASLSANKGDITLHKIVVPKDSRGQGIGTEKMRELLDFAQKNGQRIILSPSADFGGSRSRLEQFYRSLGFVPNIGRNKDFSTRETMIWTPRHSPKEAARQRILERQKAA